MQFLPAALTKAFSSSAALGNISAGIGAVTSVMGGLYQSQVANMNAQIATQNAVKAKQESAVQSQIQDIESRQEIGAMLAQMSSSGLDVGVGSGALRRRSAEELATRDRVFTEYSGQRESNAYLQQASGYKAEASAAKVGGILGGVSSLLDLKRTNLVADAKAVSPKKAAAFTSIRPRRNPVY